MSAPAIIDYLQRESGRFGQDIHNLNFAGSPWTHLIPRSEWPDGMGEEISLLVYERNAPTVANPAWSSMAIGDGNEGGNCLSPAEKLKVGNTVRTYNLERRILEGPDICVETIRSSFALREQLEGMMKAIAERVQLEWVLKNRLEYFLGCKYKVVLTASSINQTATQATSYPAADGDTVLNQGVLDTYRLKLMRDGVGQSAMGKVNNSPILTLITSAETSEQIMKADGDLRSDLREGNPNMLLQQLGVEKQLKGFFHVIDPYPRRFTYSGGVYTEVPAFVDSAATKGFKSEVNSSWETATHEESFIFDPTVITQLIPKPITAPHSKVQFDPISYNGTWKLMNIPHKTDNPDGTIVYHRGILAAGAKPNNPQRGVAIMHKRCGPELNWTTTCA